MNRLAVICDAARARADAVGLQHHNLCAMMQAMSERGSKLLSAAVGIVILLPVMFFVMDLDFQAADIAIVIVFLFGVAAGVWATRVWYRIGRP